MGKVTEGEIVIKEKKTRLVQCLKVASKLQNDGNWNLEEESGIWEGGVGVRGF